jgi:hypothetical protein
VLRSFPSARHRVSSPSSKVRGPRSHSRGIRAAEREQFDRVVIWDPLDELCDEKRCEPMRDQRILYADSHQLSYEGALSLSKGIGESSIVSRPPRALRPLTQQQGYPGGGPILPNSPKRTRQAAGQSAPGRAASGGRSGWRLRQASGEACPRARCSLGRYVGF